MSPLAKKRQVLTGKGDPEQAMDVPGKDATQAEWAAFIRDYRAQQKRRGQTWNHDDQAIFGAYVPPPKELADQYEWVPNEGYRRKPEIMMKDFSR